MRTPKAKRKDMLAAFLRDAEHGFLVALMKEHDGNKTTAAAALGIRRQALDRKIESHELQDFAAELRAAAGITGPRGG
jgi:DNA-binding protein Fis